MAKPKMTEDIIKKGRRDLSEQGHFQELRKGLDDGIIVPRDDSTIVTKKHSAIATDKESIKTTSLRISNGIYISIRKYCFENEISINSFFVDAIEKKVKRICSKKLTINK